MTKFFDELRELRLRGKDIIADGERVAVLTEDAPDFVRHRFQKFIHEQGRTLERKT